LILDQIYAKGNLGAVGVSGEVDGAVRGLELLLEISTRSIQEIRQKIDSKGNLGAVGVSGEVDSAA
jgi:hypothetical protein